MFVIDFGVNMCAMNNAGFCFAGKYGEGDGLGGWEDDDDLLARWIIGESWIGNHAFPRCGRDEGGGWI